MNLKLDSSGRIIVPQIYLKKNHPLYPTKEKLNKKIFKKFDNIILQDNWAHLPEGGI